MEIQNLLLARHNINKPPVPHRHEITIPYYDLTIVLSGSLEYTLNGKFFKVESGDFIMLPPGTRRNRESKNEITEYVSFNFKTESPVTLPLYVKGAVHSDVRMLIAAFDKMSAFPFTEGDRSRENLLVLIISLLERRIKSTDMHPLTLKIINYLRSHLAKRVTLDDIGDLTFFSPIYCDTVFKRDMGVSIVDYLLDLRIDEAKELILTNVLSLQDIAESVGFTDYNYFSRTFKRRTGYTPTAYRRLVLSGV